LSERLLQRACTEDLRRSGGIGAIAVLEATADPDLGRAVFMALRDHHRALLADPLSGEKQAIDAQLHIRVPISCLTTFGTLKTLGIARL